MTEVKISKGNQKKSSQLGEPYGTACNKMRKQLMFHLMKRCGMGICFHCGKKIDDIDKMSIEHKTPWLDSDDPVGLFYDLDNICFSHAVCNTGAARKPTKKGCPSPTSYLRGCRCNGCVESFRARQRKHWHSCGKQAREARKVREAL